MKTLPKIFSNGRKSTLLKLIFLGFLQITCVMFFAWQTQAILKLLLQNQVTLPVVKISLLVITAILCAGIRWYERYLAEKLGQNYVHETRLFLFDALSKHKDTSQKRNGIHMVRFSNDLTAISQWISLGIARSISLALLFVGVVIALTTMNIGFASIIVIGFILTVTSIIMLGQGIEKSIRQSRTKRGKLANCVNEIINNIPQLSLFGRTRFERERLVSQSQDLVSALTHRAFWLGSLTGISEFCIHLIAIVALIYGVSALYSESITLPTLMASLGISALVATPLRDFSKIFEYRKNYVVAREIIQRFISGAETTETKPSNHIELYEENKFFRGTIQFEDTQINNITIPNTHIILGEKIAIIGVNGSGKTSLLKAIAGISNTHSGVIMLDGTPTQYLDELTRRKYIGIASHDLPLTSGSISKNIRYRNPSASDHAMENALELSDSKQLINSISRGLDTRLGGRGTGLSEGQSARIKIARAILGRPPILILDDIDRCLDYDGKKALSELINNYPGSVIYSTDDIKLLSLANSIWAITGDKININNQTNITGVKP